MCRVPCLHDYHQDIGLLLSRRRGEASADQSKSRLYFDLDIVPPAASRSASTSKDRLPTTLADDMRATAQAVTAQVPSQLLDVPD